MTILSGGRNRPRWRSLNTFESVNRNSLDPFADEAQPAQPITMTLTPPDRIPENLAPVRHAALLCRNTQPVNLTLANWAGRLGLPLAGFPAVGPIP